MATELKMNLIEILEKEEMARLTAGQDDPRFPRWRHGHRVRQRS